MEKKRKTTNVPMTARIISKRKYLTTLQLSERFMVGVRGFEPPAPASRRQCSTRLSYTPQFTTLAKFQNYNDIWNTDCESLKINCVYSISNN